VKARLVIIMTLGSAILAGRVGAEPWGVTPLLGISADYASNPSLRFDNAKAEENAAALLDVPVSYDSDGMEILLRPSGRLSNSRGYSSLASNYAHLDANAQFIDDLGSASLQGQIARDSSLYFAGGFANGVGVRRDAATTAGDWTRSLTDRSQIQLDASWTRVRYDQPPNSTGLVDYRYVTAGPTFSFAATERDTLQLLGNVGRYQSLNGLTESKSSNLQLGAIRQLSETWKLNVSAGYSRSKNSERIYFGPFFLGTQVADQNGGIYAVSVTHQGERFTFTGGLSRALQPTGFAYLSRQDSLTLGVTYTQSERWSFGLNGTWQRSQLPLPSGEVFSVRYINAQFSANWHWTEQWVVSMHATRITQQYGPPTVNASSTGVSLDISRQFLRTDL
jgi:hypothetical protein